MEKKQQRIHERLNKIRVAITNSQMNTAVIARRDNLHWITGDECGVCLNGEQTPIYIIIAENETYVVGFHMDAYRFWEESLCAQSDIKVCAIYWYESIMKYITDLLLGKKAISDINMHGTVYDVAFFQRLHYPLSATEIEDYRQIAYEAEACICNVSYSIKPGMTENEIRYLLAEEYASRGIQGIVYIIGSDHRIKKYRHCIATDKKIEKLVMIAPACQKYGLTVPITRMIFFGDTLPKELERKYEAICNIEAGTLRNCHPGKTFAEIFEQQKKMYRNHGYPDEWKKHAQGGLTGYIVNDPSKALSENEYVEKNQAFNWYITISGAKVEETAITVSNRAEIITHRHKWPDKEYTVDDYTVRLPQILMR